MVSSFLVGFSVNHEIFLFRLLEIPKTRKHRHEPLSCPVCFTATSSPGVHCNENISEIWGHVHRLVSFVLFPPTHLHSLTSRSSCKNTSHLAPEQSRAPKAVIPKTEGWKDYLWLSEVWLGHWLTSLFVWALTIWLLLVHTKLFMSIEHGL